MSRQEPVSSVIRLKQKILQEAPASARRIEGVDKIFYMKAPGYDATLSASGTVSYREGWGMASRPTRYGGVIAADRALRQKGYKPYNIFTGNEWQMNELRHQAVRRDRERQEQVFQPANLPKINKKTAKNNYGIQLGTDYPMANIEYPIMDIPTETNLMPRQMQPVRKKMTWGDMDRSIENPLKQIYAEKNEIFRTFPRQQTIPNYAKSQFAAFKSIQSQIGNKSYVPQKTKNKKVKKGGKNK